MEYLIYLIAILSTSYTLIRSFFLYKIRIDFLDFALLCCQTALCEFNKIVSIDYCMSCLYHYQKMFFCFWKWNIHEMINDKKRWNEIVFFGNYKNEKSIYKPFKLNM